MILRWHLWKLRGVFYPGRALAEWSFVVAGSFQSAGHYRVFSYLLLCTMVIVLKNLGMKSPWNVPIMVIWVLLILFVLDSISVLVLFLYHAGWVHLFAWIFLAMSGGLLIRRVPVARLRPYHGVMIAMMAALLVQTTLLNRGPSASACARGKSERNLTFVVDHQEFPGLKMAPRFLVVDPQETTLFVGYRFPFFESFPGAECMYGMIRVDLGEKSAGRPVDLDCGEAIGMAFDPWANRIAAVLVYNPDNRKGEEPLDTSLVWIDLEGRVERTVPLPDIPWYEYYGSIVPTRDALYLYAGESSPLLAYDRAQDRVIRHSRVHGGTFFLAHTNHTVAEGVFYATYGGSVLSLMFQPGIAAVDLSTQKVLQRSSGFLCGTHELAYDPARREFYANSFWSGTFQVLDPALRPLRRVRVDGLVRALALDVENRRGYALRYITGEVFSFDLDTGEILGSTRISKGGRTLHVLRNGDILVGSGCGVARVSPEVFSANTANGEEGAR